MSAIFKELHQLIDEQMKLLNGKLTPEQADSCAQRNQRIRELVNLISAAGLTLGDDPPDPKS